MSFVKNWKTTLAAIAALATGISLIANGNQAEGIAAIITAIGLFFAKDANITGK